GKSRRTRELKEYFLKSTERKVIVIGDDTVGIAKNSVYADVQMEKSLRGTLRSEVERLDSLVMRFEPPDSRNRWDSPLFTVQKDDALPLVAISDAVFRRKAPAPNQSTQSQPLSSANFLHQLDRVTQDVLMVELTRSLNMVELRRLRRQFISYSKMHPTEDMGQIANMFVQYLNRNMK
ncbi:protein KTI12-like, partial [Scleropages formosus]